MTEENKEVAREGCFCPFCDQEIDEESWPFCQVCKVRIFYCPQCQKPVSRDHRVCPHCGTEIKA